MHDAVRDGQIAGWHSKFLCRHLDQHAARLGGRYAHLLAAELDAGRPGGATLVHAGGGVAHMHGDAAERHVEVLAAITVPEALLTKRFADLEQRR